MEHKVLLDRNAPLLQPSSQIYRSTKRYDHNEGLSCCFRQWRADHSHCSLLHGYALAFTFVFGCHELDKNNWCFDFGGMKQVKKWLHENFDHTFLVAIDDPERSRLEELARHGLADIRVVPSVGCEAIARQAYEHVSEIIRECTQGRVWLERAEVSEHNGNSASFER